MNKKGELFSRKKAKLSEPPPASPKGDYQWSTQSYTLKQIVEKFKLPCVVKCNVSSCSLSWENFSFDMRQPVLLYTVRKVHKMYARTLQVDPTSSEYVQYGPAIVIPEDYSGWFAVANENTEGIHAHVNPESLTQNAVRSFLNTTHVAALQMQTSLDGSVQYTQRTLNPGEVFRVGKIYIGGVSDDKKKKNQNQKKTKELKEVKYLLCYDEKDWEVLLPFGTSCRFYEIASENYTMPSKNSVVKIQDVLDGKKFPVLAQMIFGELPALMCYFTGSLHLLGNFEEETVVAATLGEEVNMMFEIGIASGVRYNLALNENIIQNSDPYRRAVTLCDSDGQGYISNMKLAFTLRPELEESEDLDFYDLESIPSYRDDNANLHSTFSDHLHRSHENVSKQDKTTTKCQTFSFDTVSI